VNEIHWDLTSIYPSSECEELRTDFRTISAMIEEMNLERSPYEWARRKIEEIRLYSQCLMSVNSLDRSAIQLYEKVDQIQSDLKVAYRKFQGKSVSVRQTKPEGREYQRLMDQQQFTSEMDHFLRNPLEHHRKATWNHIQRRLESSGSEFAALLLSQISDKGSEKSRIDPTLLAVLDQALLDAVPLLSPMMGAAAGLLGKMNYSPWDTQAELPSGQGKSWPPGLSLTLVERAFSKKKSEWGAFVRRAVQGSWIDAAPSSPNRDGQGSENPGFI
jgi:oligoendopeptidase F